MNVADKKLNQLLMLCGLVVAVSLSGCTGVKNSMRLSTKDSMWNPVEKLRAEKERETEPSDPESMVVTWKGSVYEQSGVPTVRGFGGRVFFYDKDNNAVAADGELVIYGFDESRKDPDDAKADKKFVFRSSEFQKHKSDSGFGTSYSVWVPWEQVGGFRKSITLVPVFIRNDKKVIKGGQSINVLHGKTPKRQLSDNKPYKVLGSSPAVLQAEYKDSGKGGSDVQTASFEGGEKPAKSKIVSSTIKLTPNLANRVAANASRKPLKTKTPTLSTNSGALESVSRRMRSAAKAEMLNEPMLGEEKTQEVRKVFGAPGSFN